MSALERRRKGERMRVSAYAQEIDNILRSNLDQATYEEIQEEWMDKPAVNAMWPEQLHLALLIKKQVHLL